MDDELSPEDRAWAAWCAQSSLTSRRMEQLYAMIINEISEERAGLVDDDERYFWREVKREVDETPIPDGVVIGIPSDL
jgi:hypothetical protein